MLMLRTRERMTRYRLEFDAPDTDVPAPIRLRRLLKHAKRFLDLKCVDAREVAERSNGADAVSVEPNPAEQIRDGA